MADVIGTLSGDLLKHGLDYSGTTYWNLSAEALVELAADRGEGVFTAHRALVTETGDRSGRSPNDKFIVDEPSTSNDIN